MAMHNSPLPGFQLVDGHPRNATEALVDYFKEVSLTTTVTTALQACIITHFFYYCVLHFDSEVEYIWSRSWTVGKVTYVISRYTGAIFLVLIAITILPLGWNDVGQDLGDGQSFELLVKGPCFGGYLYVVAATVAFLLAEFILALRVYALYGGQKWIIVLSVVLMTISAAGTQFLGFIYLDAPSESCIGTRCSMDVPIPFRMTGSCTVASLQLTFIGWLATSLVELVFLCLVLWKMRQLRRIDGDYNSAGDGRKKRMYARDTISSLMAHDSKIHLLWMFLLCFTGAIFNIVMKVEKDIVEAKMELGATFDILSATFGNVFVTLTISILTILAPDRTSSEYTHGIHGPVGSLIDRNKPELSWDVAVPSEKRDVDHQRSAISGRGQYSIVEDEELEDTM